MFSISSTLDSVTATYLPYTLTVNAATLPTCLASESNL